MAFVFSKRKFEEDMSTWMTDDDMREYKKNIKDPTYWVNFCDNKKIDMLGDTMGMVGAYTVVTKWCEERIEN